MSSSTRHCSSSCRQKSSGCSGVTVELFRRPSVTLFLLAVVLLQLLTLASARPRSSHLSTKRYRDTLPLTAEEDPVLVQSTYYGAGRGHRGHQPQPQQPTSLRQDRCQDDAVYAWCFMCGKVVDNRDIFFGCCRAEKRVMTFCEQLLS